MQSIRVPGLTRSACSYVRIPGASVMGTQHLLHMYADIYRLLDGSNYLHIVQAPTSALGVQARESQPKALQHHIKRDGMHTP